MVNAGMQRTSSGPPATDRVDAVVIGSGPNGLAAAITLARDGRSVHVIEGADTIGGGARTAELTLPGYQHDVCSAIHPFGRISPFFESLDIDARRTRCDAVLNGIAGAPPGRTWEAALAKRLRRRALRVMTSMAAAGTLYSPEALHEVRIAAKKLRYAFELARDLSNAYVNPLIASLKEVQDRLGRIHDLHVLDQYVRAMKWPSGRCTRGSSSRVTSASPPMVKRWCAWRSASAMYTRAPRR